MSSNLLAPPFATILLTAGESQRFEGGPKALVPVAGRPILSRLAGIAQDLGCRPVIAVVGAHSTEIRREAATGIDVFVENAGWAAGRTGSLSAGLSALPRGSGVVVWPVDVPFVEAKTVAALLRVAREDSVAMWFTPTYHGSGGHPILLRPEGVGFARRLPAALPLRAAPFRRGLGERRVPVTDPAVLDNANTLTEFARAEIAWRNRS